MKYIRTKDGIKVVNIICDDRKHYCDSDWNIVEIENSKIVDTIEELCDEFVVIVPTEKPDFVVDFSKNKQTFVKAKLDVYGAIWTDKGLIYVAKMNDKGELELI